MLTPLQLFNATTLEPEDFGAEVVSPDLDEEGKLQAALDYIEVNVLPGARSEVMLPFRKAMNDFTTQIDEDSLLGIFGPSTYEEIIALWDAAEISYGRSELNKRIDSNADSYDKDSDQDRLQGNNRLEKLVDYVLGWKAEQTQIEEDAATVLAAKNASPSSMSVPIEMSF
jgi:hypothetical protein